MGHILANRYGSLPLYIDVYIRGYGLVCMCVCVRGCVCMCMLQAPVEKTLCIVY